MLSGSLKAAAVAGLSTIVGANSISAAPVQWLVASGGNGHWYEFISTPTLWSTARDAAAASTHLGLAGHLATFTSAAEYAFAASISGATGYAGGSDSETEGVWKWLVGPEAGTTFANGSVAVAGGYAPWNAGEPNNSGDEDFLMVFHNAGGWNDAPNNSQVGYYVEYSIAPSAVPLPATLPLLAAGLGGFALLRRRRAV